MDPDLIGVGDVVLYTAREAGALRALAAIVTAVRGAGPASDSPADALDLHVLLPRGRGSVSLVDVRSTTAVPGTEAALGHWTPRPEREITVNGPAAARPRRRRRTTLGARPGGRTA